MQRNGRRFFFLDTFSRYKVLPADVAELTEIEPGQFQMGHVTSWPVRELSSIQAARVQVAADNKVMVYTIPRCRPDSGQDSGAIDIVMAVLRHLQADLRDLKLQQPSSAARQVIFPRAAKAHQDFARANGEIHSILQTDRNCQPCFVLDMPFPKEFIAPSWRCSTCHHRGTALHRTVS